MTLDSINARDKNNTRENNSHFIDTNVLTLINSVARLDMKPVTPIAIDAPGRLNAALITLFVILCNPWISPFKL